jgi:3-hydroxy acid dehydrogenase/malonic semialdehyde reductase
VNNAGYVLGIEHVGQIADSDIEGMFAVCCLDRLIHPSRSLGPRQTNVLGLISMTQLLIKGHIYALMSRKRILILKLGLTDFKAKQSGHVINIGSLAGREPYAGGAVYTATKHAVRAFTGSLLRELVDSPIRVTEIQPGSSLHIISAQHANPFHRHGRDRVLHNPLSR